ncbi:MULTISPECIES: heme/hemin ABC transporter substrate-binding protein [Mesorhizobium]|uniref:Hemin ABC transporter substrate-binding protein n=1 Tax=Mesorhizobium denitrificans TaxID=2294114 RepID=A0A371XJU2_9HYPH|nr:MULTISPECIES: hemin ABC transporter substrate-binding protein [Mesorhizobium]RFC69506.1 hemin ABC transporter substrate-binding protein [Mesorhizobium denitrificans]
MKKRGLAAAFLLAVSFAGISQSEETSTLSDTSRVVAIGGSITEIIYALGAQDRLVARDSTSVYPEAAFKLPDVGYMRQLSPEGVLSVNPSGIIALQTSGPKEAVDVLKKASVPYVEVPETFDHKGIIDKIEIVGAALGEKEKADTLAKQVDSELNAAEAITRNVTERKRVLFVLSLQGGKILAAGSDTAADGMIHLAGAENAMQGLSGYKQMTDEAVVSAKPDAILVMDRAGQSISDDQVLQHPAIATTPAGEAKKIVRMDGSYLLGFGPRTASAVRELATALYGETVGN